MFISSYFIEKCRIIISITEEVITNYHVIITLVLRQDAWHSVLGNMRHIDVIIQNFVANIMANLYCCCETVYRLGAVSTHQRCNFLDVELSSNCMWPTSAQIF